MQHYSHVSILAVFYDTWLSVERVLRYYHSRFMELIETCTGEYMLSDIVFFLNSSYIVTFSRDLSAKCHDGNLKRSLL